MENPTKKEFELKQSLIVTYHKKIKELKSERKLINAKLLKCSEKFEELIHTKADSKQLELFRNLDNFLN